MPTSGISAASRSRPPGSRWCCRRCCSTISGRARCCCAIRPRSPNPFYQMVPEMLLLPMVVLATAATVIASQAVITGAYSLTYQAIQLGLLPRLAILHTSAAHFGQIYIPRVNTALLAGVLLLVLMFRTSSAARVRLRHRGDDHDGGRRRARLHRDLEAVEVEMVERGAAGRAARHRRRDFPEREPAQAVRRRLGCRCCSAAAMVLLIVTWQRGSRILVQKTRRVEVPLDSLIRQPGEEAAAHGAGHRGVPDQRSAISRRPRCCTISSTTRCCTSTTSS